MVPVIVLVCTCLTSIVHAKCGYEACHQTKPGMLNVHVNPHTHLDVGWLKTPEQYYKCSVKAIIDGVVEELSKNPHRKFSWVETAYLKRWWMDALESDKIKLKELVQNGQMEITSGGWVMNDEAVTHYQSIIDQFTLGFRTLDEYFGVCGHPRIGWQADTFGHSSETASVLAHFGFDGMFFGRFDYQDRTIRLRRKTAEFVWQPSRDLGASSDIFASAFYWLFYRPPPGFCFDANCKDEEIIDDESDLRFNVPARVDEFLRLMSEQAEQYATNNILVNMGDDFHYTNANKWFTNLDKLIKHVNERQSNGSKVHLLYSTPACYLKSLNDVQTVWTTKQDDFFPYASTGDAYWTGYYTSRPTLKYFERRGNQILQTVKQLSALHGGVEGDGLNALREMMGVMQHHDAITGTSRQDVVDDHVKNLYAAIKAAENESSNVLSAFMVKSDTSPEIKLETCLLSNISQCEISEENERFVIVAYNPLAHRTSQYIRIPVPGFKYKVYDNKGEEIETQMVPIPYDLENIPGRKSGAIFEVVFEAIDLPAVGFKSYYIQKFHALEAIPSMKSDAFTIGNENLKVNLNIDTGLLESVTVNDEEIEITQNFAYYASNGVSPSGAYIFRPKDEFPTFVAKKVLIKTFKGPLVEEIHQKYSDWISQVIRVYKGQNQVEFEWLVGPLPIEKGEAGIEVISKYCTNWRTNGIFYTDSNGRGMMERRRNHRPTWDVTMSKNVSGNYYPVTTIISMKSDDNELAILTDRAQGGTSLQDGHLELMVHRRLLRDDYLGMGQALDEEAYNEGLVVRGRHILILKSQRSTVIEEARKIVHCHIMLPPVVFMTPTDVEEEQWRNLYHTSYEGVRESVSGKNLHLLTLEPWGSKGSILLRLENFISANDNEKFLKGEVKIHAKNLFRHLDIISMEEMTLGGNKRLAEMKRLSWSTLDQAEQRPKPADQTPTSENNFMVVLSPMQIRTFVVQVNYP